MADTDREGCECDDCGECSCCNCSECRVVDLYLYNSQLYFLATLSFKYSDFFSKILEIVSTGLIYAIFYLEFLLYRNS